MSIKVEQTHNVTIAEVEVVVRKEPGVDTHTGPAGSDWRDDFDFVTVKGDARRNPMDRHNPEIGVLLAQARAYEKLARKIRRQAEGMVRNAEHVRMARQTRQAIKKKEEEGKEGVVSISFEVTDFSPSFFDEDGMGQGGHD